MRLGLRAFIFGKEAGQVLIHQPVFHLRHRQDVAVADHQIDVVHRDAFGIEAIIDDFLVEAAGVLLPGNPLLGDGIGDRTIPQQAGAHVVVVSIEAEDVSMFFWHWRLSENDLTTVFVTEMPGWFISQMRSISA